MPLSAQTVQPWSINHGNLPPASYELTLTPSSSSSYIRLLTHLVQFEAYPNTSYSSGAYPYIKRIQPASGAVINLGRSSVTWNGYASSVTFGVDLVDCYATVLCLIQYWS